MGEFKLSASLAGHDDDVRAVAFTSPKAVISASRDATVRLWQLISPSPPTFDASISSHGTAFVNAVTYLPPNTDFVDGLIISGGKDTIVEVRRPGKAPEDNAEALLIGHAHNVCALDVDPAGNFIVSGSWDGKARVWSVGRWNCEAVLEGHEGSVWAVLALDKETILTGSADKLIRIFHSSGKLLKTIKGSSDVVRALCRVPKGHPSGADFASAGNDSLVRLWRRDGRQLGVMHGHESFIYSLACLSTGELVSSGEDRTIRIWRGEACIQTITLPAISVWAVATCSENGDVVAGASDRIVRVFTRDSSRVADAETIQAFEESVKSSSIPRQQLPEINKEKLPGPDFLQRKAGTKEGQVQMISEPNGSVTAHQWSSTQQQWISIGTVVDAVGSSGKKVEYLGQDYDYVFDVDIEEGKPPLKLPYNLSQNPYEAATKFLQDNELPITYLDTVANFVTQNIQGATLGGSQNQQLPPAGHDPWGTESRYRPGGATTTPTAPPAAPKVLPQKTYLSILVARYDSMEKKIHELNTKLIQSGHKELSLNPIELTALSTIIKQLSSSGNTQSSSTTEATLDLAIKTILQWPYPDRLPGLDLFRLLAINPATATFTHPSRGNIIAILIASVTEQDPPAENHVMMAIRAFANLFESPQGRAIARVNFPAIQTLVTRALGGEPHSSNRNLLVAITTLYINFAVLFSSAEAANNSGKTEIDATAAADSFEHPVQLLATLSTILKTQMDSEVIYRALVALGTLLGLGEEIRGAAVEVYAIEGVVQGVMGKAKDPRVKNVGGELKGLLK